MGVVGRNDHLVVVGLVEALGHPRDDASGILVGQEDLAAVEAHQESLEDHQVIGRWSGSRLALEGRRGALYVFAGGDRSSVTGEVKVEWANGSQNP